MPIVIQPTVSPVTPTPATSGPQTPAPSTGTTGPVSTGTTGQVVSTGTTGVTTGVTTGETPYPCTEENPCDEPEPCDERREDYSKRQCSAGCRPAFRNGTAACKWLKVTNSTKYSCYRTDEAACGPCVCRNGQTYPSTIWKLCAATQVPSDPYCKYVPCRDANEEIPTDAASCGAVVKSVYTCSYKRCEYAVTGNV